jgi:hypothetical protein
MDAGPEAIAAEIASAVAEATAPQEALLLFGPGAELLYGKLMQLPQSTLAPMVAANIILGKGLRWGNAQTLLEIARETDIFANPDFSAGPEYIRKSV